MPKIRKICIFIGTFLVMIFALSVNIYAESKEFCYSCIGTGNVDEIDLSDEKLFKCRDKITNPVSIEKTISYTNTISEEYGVDIYRFYIPRDGYYTAYTTGVNDPILRIYREHQMLWWVDGFIGDYRTQDDGSKCSNNVRNACSVEYLARGYYYVAVRLKDKSRGTYTINIGPNEDLLYRNTNKGYNRWISDTKFQSGQNLVNQWTYFSMEETLFFYWLLTDQTSITVNLQEYIDKYGTAAISASQLIALFQENPSMAIDISGIVVGGLASAAGFSAGASTAISVGFLVLSYLASDLKHMFNQQFKDSFISKCGILAQIDSISQNGMGIRIVAERCLILKHSTIPTTTFPHISFEVDSYYSNSLYFRGEKYDKGHWVKA